MNINAPSLINWVILITIATLIIISVPTATCEVFSLEELWEIANENEWEINTEEPVSLSHTNSIFEICQSWTQHLGDWSPSDSSFVRITRVISLNTVSASNLVYNSLRNNSVTWGDLYPLVETANDAFDINALAHEIQAINEKVAEPGTDDPWYSTPTFSTVYENWEISYLTLGNNLPIEGWPENHENITGLILNNGNEEFFVVKLIPTIPSNPHMLNHDASYHPLDLNNTSNILWNVQNNLIRPETTLEFSENFGLQRGTIEFRGLYHLNSCQPPLP